MTKMRLGVENRRQVWLLLSLITFLVALAAWEFHGASTTNAATTVRSTPTGSSRGSSKGLPQQSLSEPELHLAQIIGTENTSYQSSSRNIFSLESEPVVVEAPLAPPRPIEEAKAVAPSAPIAPPIEVRYLGYTRNVGESAYNAILIHKDESLIAHQGDIVFHRYKVVSIQPASVQITDLGFKNTQTLPIIEK